jgi:hypothetical protein
MSTVTTPPPPSKLGLINAIKSKPSEPKPSPKNFKWPHFRDATNKEKQAFAATLQELLPLQNGSHVTLAKTLWGTDDRDNARNIGVAREWVRATGRFATEKEAGYVAQVLGVSMQRLLEPTIPFDPNTPMVRPMRTMPPRSEWKTKDKLAKKANGHDTSDTRWVLPPGVPAPTVKFETSKKHQSLVLLTLQGEMPLEVAMAIMSMANAKSGD